MRIVSLILFCLALCAANAETVKIDFEVRDMQGRPIEGALVKMRMNEQPSFPYKETPVKVVSCVTDKVGMASKEFSCWEGYVNCFISAEGYYAEEIKDVFKSNYNERTQHIDFYEKYKKIEVRLYPKVNPIEMYSYLKGLSVYHFENREMSIGYDLRLKSCVAPYGKGEVADFYIHHTYSETNGVMRFVSELTFPEGGGAYVVKKTAGMSRVLVYEADTNVCYKTQYTGECTFDVKEKNVKSCVDVLSADEALVIRSRVKLDPSGNILHANYSKIYGPFRIARMIDFQQLCFNPNINDRNLEFDVRKNRIKRQSGVFYP